MGKDSGHKASHVQKAIHKAAMALADSIQTLLRAQRTAGAQTLQHTHTAIKNSKQTDELSNVPPTRASDSPCLQPSLSGLCGESTPMTQWLFGDTLAANHYEAKELDKLDSAEPPEQVIGEMIKVQCPTLQQKQMLRATVAQCKSKYLLLQAPTVVRKTRSRSHRVQGGQAERLL